MADKKTEQNWKAIDISSIVFLKELEDIKVRKDILFRVVNWQLAKRRAGTHNTKEEGDVRGSGKKIHRQKGTGAARQGSKRGPHFRGGAVIFGPHVRDHSFSLQKKVRSMGLKHAVASKLQTGQLKIFESLNLDTFKTKALVKHLKTITDSSKVLFVDENNDNLLLGTRGIIGMDIIPACGLNVYDILKHDVLVMSQDALSKIEKRLSANG